MTVNPRPNPKKMRPYDEPPKRRRSLIPGGPDSAATGFLVAAAAWFVVATGLGTLALDMRFMPFELSFPFGVFDLGFELNQQRVDYAFVNATVYGWLTNAGFAALAFMTPRLLGRPMVAERGMNIGLGIWNLALLGGMASLYVFEWGPNAPLTAFPWFVDGGLATGALLVTGAFLATAGAGLRTAYVSVWFAGIALLSLLGLVGLNAGMGLVETFFELPDLTVALGSVFIERAITVLWLLGMAYAALYYVVPRATGQPLESAGLAMLAWIAWLFLAPLSALGVLLDTSVPFLFTTIGGLGTMLLLLPAAITVVNLTLSVQGRWSLVFGVGPVAFAAVALAFLLATALLEAIGALPSVRASVGGTDWERGVFVWAAYGTFTIAALALSEHALPRLLRRAWGGGPLSAAQLWLVFGGATLAGLALMGAGMAEGSLRAQSAAPEAIADGVLGYVLAAFAGMAVVALGSLATLVNLFLAYTSGEPAEYAVPNASTATAGH
jgi:cytochrome c oxidase cbb3-type subunit I